MDGWKRRLFGGLPEPLQDGRRTDQHTSLEYVATASLVCDVRVQTLGCDAATARQVARHTTRRKTEKASAAATPTEAPRSSASARADSMLRACGAGRISSP